LVFFKFLTSHPNAGFLADGLWFNHKLTLVNADVLTGFSVANYDEGLVNLMLVKAGGYSLPEE